MLHARLKKGYAQFDLDVEFKIGPGIIGILGPSGSGKSLTLQAVAGLKHPDEGFIQINDRVLLDTSNKIRTKTKYRKVGYMFQNYALFPHLTVKQNMAFGLKGMPKSVKEQKIRSFLKKIKLDGYENRYPEELSGGEQQRVAFARTLITEPDCLLLDEPFSALDSNTKQFLIDEFLSIIKENFHGIVLFVTHHLEEVNQLCDHLILYKDGKILQEGTKEEVLSKPVSVEAAKIVGCKNILKIEPIDGNKVLAGGNKIVTDGKPETSQMLGIHAHHVCFTRREHVNTFEYEVLEIKSGLESYDVTVKTKQMVLHANVPPGEIHSVLACKKKLYLPREHLILLSE